MGTEKAAERVTAAHEAEEAGGPSSIAQIAFKPKWIDEAHKATGQHAYVQAVRMLRERSGGFRVLALSATPGRDPMAVQQAG